MFNALNFDSLKSSLLSLAICLINFFIFSQESLHNCFVQFYATCTTALLTVCSVYPVQVRGLYKGLASPMLSQAAVCSVLFSSYGTSLRLIQPREGQPRQSSTLLAGAFSGVCQSIIACPTDLIKLRMQTQGIGLEGPGLLSLRKASRTYIGPLESARRAYKSGGIGGLNKGLLAVLWRDTIGYSAYFTAYSTVCYALAGNKPIDSIGPIYFCIAASAAGIAYWALVFPLDVVKSRMQVDGVYSPPNYHGMIDCIRKIFHREGWQAFYNGYRSALLRSIPANATVLCALELLLRHM